MKSTMIVTWGCAAVLAALGCDAGSAPATTGNGKDAGAVTMSLRSAAGGATYVLANATFSVARVQPPPDPGDLSVLRLHQSDPTAGDLIAAGLPVGWYEITLIDGWELEREDTPTSLVPVHATLLSPNPVTVSVFSDQTTTVTFQLQTNGIPLTFGPGTIDIGTAVGTCDVAAPAGVELNIIADPGFEVDAAGWLSVASFSPDAHCGARSGVANVGVHGGVLEYLFPASATPTTYAISGWLKAPNGSGTMETKDGADDVEPVTVAVYSDCTGSTLVGSAVARRSGWTHFTAPASVGGAGCSVGSLIIAFGDNTTLLLDDVYVVPQ